MLCQRRHADTPILVSRALYRNRTVTKNSRNFAAEVLNCRGSVENGNFRAIDAPFARLQHDQLAGRLHRIATEAVGTGFDAHRILAFGHHAPLDVARHDALIIADRHTEPEPRIDDCDMHAAGRVGGHLVRESLLREVRLRRDEGRPASRVIEIGRAEKQLRPRSHRGDQLRAGIDERKADVEMIEEHVLDRHEGAVFDHVFHNEGCAAELGAIGARHHEIFAIRLRLCHAADGLHDQIVAFPAFHERDELRRYHGRAVVHSVALQRAGGKIVVPHLGGLRIADVDKTARVVEAAERRTQPAEFGLLLEIPGAGHQSWRHPGERGAAVFGAADVHAAVERDLEHEAGPGAEFDETDAARGTIVRGKQPDAAKLGKVADPALQLGPAPSLPKELCHRLHWQ